MQTFTINKSAINTIRGIGWFLVLSASSLLILTVIVLLSFSISGSKLAVVFFALLCVILLEIGWKTLYKTKTISSIALDSEGLWPVHTSKAIAPIPWERIYSVKEQNQLGLDLLDTDGKILVKLYCLSDFATLCNIVIKKTQRDVSFYPSLIKKNILYHLFSVGYIIFDLLLLWHGKTNVILVPAVLGFMLGLCWLLYYFTSIYKLVVTKEHLEICYPLYHRCIRCDEITDILCLFRLTPVGVFIRGDLILVDSNQKPITIRMFNTSSLKLYQMLMAWKNAQKITH